MVGAAQSVQLCYKQPQKTSLLLCNQPPPGLPAHSTAQLLWVRNLGAVSQQSLQSGSSRPSPESLAGQGPTSKHMWYWQESVPCGLLN